jgi:hypothetical protein
MDTGGLILIVGALAAAAGAFIWLAFKLENATPQKDVEHIFNDDFREELRNRGRLHFEKIIGDNAIFLQQDLRNTTTQLNEYMRGEISKTLQEEFKKYEQSITDAKQIAMESIQKTVQVIEQQRQYLEKQLQDHRQIRD